LKQTNFFISFSLHYTCFALDLQTSGTQISPVGHPHGRGMTSGGGIESWSDSAETEGENSLFFGMIQAISA